MKHSDREIRQIVAAELTVPAIVNTKFDAALAELGIASYAYTAPKQKMPLARRRVVVVAIAAALMLSITGTAFAVGLHYGIFDYLGGYRQYQEVLPEASTLISAPTDVQAGGEVQFAVREILYDGEVVFVVIAATSSDERYLLLGNGDPESPVSILGSQYAGNTTTIADYAKANSREVLSTSVSFDRAAAPIEQEIYDVRIEDDGTVVYLLRGKPLAPPTELTLTCIWRIYNTEDFEKTQILLPVPTAPTNKILKTNCAVEFTDCGVRVDRITLTATPLGLYYRIEYTITNTQVFDAFSSNGAGMRFSILGADGEPLVDGDGHFGRLPDDATRGEQTGQLAAAAEFPDSLTLRGYTAGHDFGSNSYQAHEIQLDVD